MTSGNSLHKLKRQAKTEARKAGLPLHQALDRVAKSQGFASWSLLASSGASDALYQHFIAGDMLIVAARPGQGKTLTALRLAVEAAQAGNHGYFFSLEYMERDVASRLETLGIDCKAFDGRFHFDGSDDISASYIISAMGNAPAGSVAAVDYLQLLDQRRDKPPLSEQVATLREFAQRRGVILAFIAQIDRAYDPLSGSGPGPADIRLPNPIDVGATFDKGIFLSNGHLQITTFPT